MNVKTLLHGGEPKKGISPMLSLLLVKSCKLQDCILKQRESNITCIYMNLGCSRLGTENLDMLISIYKNWPEDARVGGSLSMKKFMEMEET